MQSSSIRGAAPLLSLALLLCAGRSPVAAQVAPPLTTLYSFTGGADGGYPAADLVLGPDGSLYGTTSGEVSPSYGSVFKITSKGVFSTLYSFTGGADGANPMASVTLDSVGNLYGTTSLGGAYDAGTVWALSPSTGFRVLHTFTGDDGANPMGGLVGGKGGAFYGTTTSGGVSQAGTIYAITPSGVLTSLFSFNYGDGLQPTGRLLTDRAGNLYGTTFSGGYTGGGFSSQAGTLFAFVPGLPFLPGYDFSTPTGGPPPTNADGANPLAGLVRDRYGNFYGTTSAGGAYGYGTVFLLRPVGRYPSQLVTLYSFTGGADGGAPYADLVFGKDGALYGATGSGGLNLNGTVFRITPDGSTFSTLYTFSGLDPFGNSADGGSPSAGLTVGRDGNLYGTGWNGGVNGHGTIFKLTMTPFVTQFGPLSGPVGARVTLTGLNLTETTSVKLGKIAAAFVVNSDTSLTVTIPTGAVTARFTVTNPFGSGTSGTAFKVTH